MYRNVYQGYVDDEILSADPMRTIVLMYRGAIEAVSEARRALAAGDIRLRSKKITKAAAILNELAASLDHGKAPELCRNLVELYDYMCRRLNEANAFQIDPPIAEVERLLADLSEAWQQAAHRESAEASVGVGYLTTGPEYEPLSCAY